jgi:hypothetical protein
MNREQKRKMARMAKSDGRSSYKSMMRAQTLANAADSLSAKELEEVMVKGAMMSYVTTVLDDNGVPISGETKQLKISNIDIQRLQNVLATKQSNEQQYLETQGK